ncbi:MAG: diacylglycerol kinase family protein [Bacteroides sp.]|nr:diacylglycerol kinase family protein [Bacteroides sp.]MBQ8874666.1 diacylglycerol kinase family protein [Bacteroides sp.]
MNELKKRIKSFVYAFQGIGSFLKKEHNAWIHCTAIVLVTWGGFHFQITSTEWCIVLLCFGLVLAAEAFNTAIERLVNLVSPDYHPLAGDVKDVAAGAVLICAITAAIIGCIIFLPYLLDC